MIHFTPKHSQSLDFVVSDMNRQAFLKAIVFWQAIGWRVIQRKRAPATVDQLAASDRYSCQQLALVSDKASSRHLSCAVRFASLFTLYLDLPFILPSLRCTGARRNRTVRTSSTVPLRPSSIEDPHLRHVFTEVRDEDEHRKGTSP